MCSRFVGNDGPPMEGPGSRGRGIPERSEDMPRKPLEVGKVERSFYKPPGAEGGAPDVTKMRSICVMSYGVMT